MLTLESSGTAKPHSMPKGKDTLSMVLAALSTMEMARAAPCIRYKGLAADSKEWAASYRKMKSTKTGTGPYSFMVFLFFLGSLGLGILEIGVGINVSNGGCCLGSGGNGEGCNALVSQGTLVINVHIGAQTESPIPIGGYIG